MKNAKETAAKNPDITGRKRKEEEASRMVTVVRDSNDAITIQDFDGKVLAWNRGAELMYGYSEEEALQKNIWLLTPPNREEEQKDFTRRLIAGEKITSLETQRVTKDGRILDIWMTVTKLVDDTGKPIGIASTERDITDRKRAEEKLILSEAFLNGVIEQSPESLWVSDSDGTMIRMNPACRELFGITDEEVVGKYNLFKDNLIEAQGFMPLVEAVFRKGEIARFTIDYDLPRVEHIKVSGAMHRIVDVVISPIKDRSGKVTNAIIQHKDVTERKQAEEVLRASSIYSRNLLETSLDPLVTISAEGRITDVNTATEKITGMSRKRLIGSDFSDYFTEPEMARAGYQKVFEQGQVTDYPLAIRHPSGVITDVLYNASIYRNEQGKVLGVFAAARDITERKRAEEETKKLNESLERRVRERTNELQASNKELEAFAYSVSHDLRAPLRIIDGFSHALLEDYDDKLDVQGKDYLRRVRASTQMMAQLIDDMLKLSRITRTEMNIEKVNLTQIARSVIDELQKSQPERLINIKIADGLEDTADPKLMRIALENLLGNAWKFTGKQAEAVIEFGSTQEGGRTVYFIRDNGAGFDMAYVDKLFAPFQRLHTMEEYPGTGIGLATVQRVINRHGGRVWAEGQVDKGATFYFSLQG